MAVYVIGVDVGTGSARAALVSADGDVVKVASYATRTWSQVVDAKSKTGAVLTLEQSSDDIWRACCRAVTDVIQGVPTESIKGIGFDATCSLVALDEKGKPVTVSVSGDDQRNVILWMDHRAVEEAEWINSMKNDVLKYVGGNISLEMETPKLVWLKKNLKEKCWNRASHFMDLPDFLTWRATNSYTSRTNILFTVVKQRQKSRLHALSIEALSKRMVTGMSGETETFFKTLFVDVNPLTVHDSPLKCVTDNTTWLNDQDKLLLSLCSLVCKWTYRAGDGPNGTNSGWSQRYFAEIGLEDLADKNWSKIGNEVLVPGAPCGNGLTQDAANELGLLPGTAVGTSIIDAHAGGLGLLGCQAEGISNDFPSRLALICGTSTCHMAVERRSHFVRGVWGPYWSAMMPGMWLSEGGQSATGCLVDHVINTHPATAALRSALPEGVHIQSYLNDLLDKIAEKRSVSNVAELTSRLHVWPDFHGNRSPVADPALLGMISGFNLSTDEENLAVLYLATIQALAYGTRHIMEALQSSGLSKLESVLLCGGLSRNRLFVQSHADILGLPVLCAREPESVLLGAAMLGAYAAGLYTSVDKAVLAMGGPADKILPDKVLAESKYHEKKYIVFKKMLEDQREYDRIMAS